MPSPNATKSAIVAGFVSLVLMACANGTISDAPGTPTATQSVPLAPTSTVVTGLNPVLAQPTTPLTSFELSILPLGEPFAMRQVVESAIDSGFVVRSAKFSVDLCELPGVRGTTFFFVHPNEATSTVFLWSYPNPEDLATEWEVAEDQTTAKPVENVDCPGFVILRDDATAVLVNENLVLVFAVRPTPTDPQAFYDASADDALAAWFREFTPDAVER